MTRYLICRDGETVLSQRAKGGPAGFSYPVIREFLSERYQQVASPLERMPVGGRRVIVYLSPNRNGHGRIEANFQEWAVADAT